MSFNPLHPRTKINLSQIPEEEGDFGSDCNTNLDQISRFIDAFAKDLILFNFSKQHVEMWSGKSNTLREMYLSFCTIAARDGGLNIFHFRHALGGINTAVQNSEYLSSVVNLKDLENCFVSFHQNFPKWDKVRHGIAHAGETMKSSQKHHTHSFSGNYNSTMFNITNSEGIVIHDCLNISSGEYTTTYAKEIISYYINSNTLAKLNEIRNKAYSAINPKYLI